MPHIFNEPYITPHFKKGIVIIIIVMAKLLDQCMCTTFDIFNHSHT